MPQRIAFIGLGLMGKPMARNLLRAFEVRAYNRSRPPVDELASEGAIPAASAAEAAREADFVITMLPDSPDVDGVYRALMPDLSAGQIAIDMSTISPAVVRRLAEDLGRKSVPFLDAPVSGGTRGAAEGTLSIMVGGDEEAFRKARPVFDAMGKRIIHMGPSGNGQLTKLCNQILCGLNLQAVCEALSLGWKAGLELDKLIEAVSAGAAGSWALSNLGPKIVARDFRPGFKMDHQQKDLRLALEAAAELGLPLPGTGLVHELFRAVQAMGAGTEGTQAAIKAMEALGGYRLARSE